MFTVKQIEQRMIDEFDDRKAFEYLLEELPEEVYELLAELVEDEGYKRDNVNIEKVSYSFNGMQAINFEDYAEIKQDTINELGSLDKYMENNFYEDLAYEFMLAPELEIIGIEDAIMDINVTHTQDEINSRLNDVELKQAILGYNPEEIRTSLSNQLMDDNVDINNIDLDKVDFEITQSYLLTPVYEVAESEQEFIESIGDYTTYFNRYFYERLVTKYNVTVDIEIKNLDDLLYEEE